MEQEQLMFEKWPLRIVKMEDKVYVSLTDIAKAIDLSGGRFTRSPYKHTVFYLKTGGGTQPVHMISQEDAVSMVFKCRAKRAEPFRQWFMVTVLGIPA